MSKIFFISIIFIASSLFSLYLKAQDGDKYIDSLKSLLDYSVGKSRVDILNKISRAYWPISYTTALEFSSQAYKAASRISYMEGMADAANRSGNVYYHLKDSTRALYYYQKALELAKAMGDENKKGMIYNNIGLLYANFNKYNKALEFYFLSLESTKKNGDKHNLATTTENIGDTYFRTNSFNKSLEYYSRLIEILTETKDTNYLARAYDLYGSTFMKLLEFDKALKNHTIAYNLYEALGDSAGMLNSFFYAGQALSRNNILHAAREHFNYTLEKAKRTNNLEITRDVLYEYSLLYEKEKNFEKAYNYSVQFARLKDSIQKLQAQRLLEELRFIYETEITDNQTEYLKTKNEIQVSQLKNEKNLKTYLQILLILGIVIVFVVGNKFYLKHRLNKNLKEKLKILKETNHRLKKSEESLRNLNITKDKFFSIIAHDLKNPFNALMGYSELLSANIDELPQKDMIHYVEIIHNSAKNFYRLLENLLLWSASQTGKIFFAPVNFDLSVLVQKEITLQKNALSNKKITVYNKIEPGVIVYADFELISMTFYNLLENAIKVTPVGGIITLSTVTLKNFAEISITHTSSGLNEEELQKLFQLDSKQIGSAGQNIDSLGLILCKIFLERNSGYIDVISKINKGTTYIVSIPLSKRN